MGFSRQHPSWPSWINCECPTCRTWKVLSFLLCLRLVLSESKVPLRYFEFGDQNWFSNNPGLPSQVLSAFLLGRYRRVLKERKRLVKGGTAKPALQRGGVQVLLFLAFAVCSILSSDKIITQPKLHKRCKLPQLYSYAFCLQFKKKKASLSGNNNWSKFNSC